MIPNETNTMMMMNGRRLPLHVGSLSEGLSANIAELRRRMWIRNMSPILNFRQTPKKTALGKWICSTKAHDKFNWIRGGCGGGGGGGTISTEEGILFPFIVYRQIIHRSIYLNKLWIYYLLIIFRTICRHGRRAISGWCAAVIENDQSDSAQRAPLHR